VVLESSGGLPGDNEERLFAACARPFQTAFGEPAFPSSLKKAAVLFHGIIAGHVFVDGNKRTATIAALFLLVGRGYLKRRPDPLRMRLLGEIAVETASAGLDPDEIAQWFERILAD
jgi:death-on-curing protein